MLTGFEYGVGIKNLKVSVAKVSDTTPKFQLQSIPKLRSIRNIIYNDMNIVIRKAVSYLFVSIFKAPFTAQLD